MNIFGNSRRSSESEGVSASSACVTLTPGFSVPKQRRPPLLGLLLVDGICNGNQSCAYGGLKVGSVKPRGRTPTTVYDLLFNVRFWPTTFRSAPNRSRHRLLLSITTSGPPIWPSSGRKLRPRIG